MKTNKTLSGMVISGLLILFSANLYGCSNQQVDMEAEQDDFEIIQGQYITTEDLQNSVQALVQGRIIQDQSFSVDLNEWGNVEFISYEPESGIVLEDVSFYLVKDDQVIYEFPYYCEGNNSGNYFGLFYNVEAVGFRDLNNDGKDDVIIIISYIPGVGPEGAVPRLHARIFLAEEKGFYVAEDMMTDIYDHIAEKDLTVNNVYQYILSKDVEKGTAEVFETGDEIEKVREYMIPEQSFDVSLNDWGEVTFVSCMPMPDADGYTDPHADVSFYLVSGERIIYRFPYINYREGIIAPPGVSFVTFTDVNEDGKDDVVIGILYFGVGYMQQNDPRMEVRVYIDNGDDFMHDKSRFDESGGLDCDTK